MSTSALPIQALHDTVLATPGPLVISAPTGSGKSTVVPGWLPSPVLVVEPRRVACRALAARVAELEGGVLGDEVGYTVRGERRPGSRIHFVTPGIALRMAREGGLKRVATLVLDEFHERGMDTDLLMALAQQAGHPRLVVMSATIAGDRIAAHLGGTHLRGEGRQFPVELRAVPGEVIAPELRGLEGRVLRALSRAEQDTGDVLVFLPGKAEIASVARAVPSSWEVLTLHGGLSLEEQARIFQPGPRRRVILSTNVAETSLTVPRIGVVIDAGLVRRTRYRKGRGSLTLLPIALDSADQRAGRAGRLGPGVCYRLWRADARLDAHTPPEIHREDLSGLLLAAAACGAPDLDLPLLDPPRDFAVAEARAVLDELGALDPDGLTERGARMFGLGLDARLARLLIEAEARGTLEPAIALAAALSTSRRLFYGEAAEEDLREAGCDAVALIRAVREGRPGVHGLDRAALREAREHAERFATIFGRPAPRGPASLDRRALAETLLAAWPDCAHMARRHGRRVGWSNGGTELSLGRDSAVEQAEAVLVLDSRSFGSGTRTELRITAAMPVPIAWLVRAGLGRDRLGHAAIERRRVVGKVERVYARKVIDVREVRLSGGLLREACRDLFLAHRLWKPALAEARERHEVLSLHARLQGVAAPPPLDEWVSQRLNELGLEDPDDIELIEPGDLLPDALPAWERAELDRQYPRAFSVGDATYRITYAVGAKVATLHQVKGRRKEPPPPGLLPRLPGWRIDWEHKNRVRRVRG